MVGPLGVVGEGVLDAVLLFLQGQERGERLDDLFVHRPAAVDDAILGQVADGGVRGHADPARVGLFGARQHAQQRRLARSVGPGEADAVLLLDVPGHVLEEDAVAVTLGQSLDVDHRIIRAGSRPSG